MTGGLLGRSNAELCRLGLKHPMSLAALSMIERHPHGFCERIHSHLAPVLSALRDHYECTPA